MTPLPRSVIPPAARKQASGLRTLQDLGDFAYWLSKSMLLATILIFPDRYWPTEFDACPRKRQFLD